MAVGGMTGAVKNLKGKDELEKAVKGRGSLVVLHFWASWCEPSKAMDPVFTQLAIETPQAQFFRVEAEEQPEISESYDVAAVPCFLCIKDGAVVDKLQGANAPELATKVAKWAGSDSSLNGTGHASNGHDAARPIGIDAVQKEPPPAALPVSTPPRESISQSLPEAQKAVLYQLVNSKAVMLFMKGTPEEPRCGFSRKVVDVLKAVGVEFGSFDILSDETVRQGMKTYANWPTFPQLYMQGELLGGCDIILEMNQSGELNEVLAEKGLLPKESLDSRLKNLITSSTTMLFMKGTPEEPRCGFSKKVVNALKDEGVEFGSFNILEDEDVRQGLKTYSNWPTYPQLYYKGELLGGCDIVLEMKDNGELKSTLAE